MKQYTPEAEAKFESDLDHVMDKVRLLLLEKNKAYGDSAMNPVRVFSKMNAMEQLKVRMDDKLSRLARGNELKDESFDDTILDLTGYLFIYMIQREYEKSRNFNPC